MGELLEVYSLSGELLEVEDRDKYYQEIREEFKTTGRITRKVKSIRMLLLTSQGGIYIHRRSKRKKENSGLYDKTVGGHVIAGCPWELTVVQSCYEELGFPAVVLSEDQFELAMHATDVRIIGVFRKVETIHTFLSVRKAESGDFRQPFTTCFYFGYYDGSIRFCVGESAGIEIFTREELESAINKSPENFTEDLKFMVKRYRQYLVPAYRDEKIVLGYESGERLISRAKTQNGAEIISI